MTKKLKLLLVALVLLLPLPILALEIHNNDNVVLGTDKVIDGNYYAAGKNIDIYGTVNGNLYLAAEYINIDSSNINGDIFFVAAKDITINGKVKGSIHGVADKVNIRAQVQNNVMAFGQNINIESDAYIMQHLTVFGQRVVLDAKVGGHLEGFVESILINGQVEKNVDIHVSTGKDKNSLQISETATINGELKYKAWQEGNISDQATIAGGVSFDQLFKTTKSKAWGLGMFKTLLIQFFGMLVVGMVLFYLWPKFLSRACDKTHQSMLITFFKGLGLLILTPVAVVILLFTVIGIPLALILLGLWFVMLYLAKVIAAWLLIRFLQMKFFAKKKISNISLLALGILLFIIISKIPIIGWVVMFVLFITAWGTIFDYIFKTKKQ
jgi:cytoskeletal protein CcmA (bactofilin family)